MIEEEIKTEVEAQVKAFGLEGGMIVVTVGSEQTSATYSDMERVADTVNETIEGLRNIRALIVPHLVKVDMIPIKSLFENNE